MTVVAAPVPVSKKKHAATCYHCGEPCFDNIEENEKSFCCQGCRQVYLLLAQNDLCNYYRFDKNPGITAKGKFSSGKFAWLDDEQTATKLVQFSTATQINVVFQLPQVHCASCIYLLENLHQINEGIIKSQANFQRKEVLVIFNPAKITLRQVVELLAFVGYEPYISLQDVNQKNKPSFNKKRIYQIGVAGFGFANIMMLSFPEYFADGQIEQAGLQLVFTWLCLLLSLPVLFYSAGGFFISAYKGIRQRYLNIDAPIALAILVTYARSYYEIILGTGAGYLDSGTGIVFFMLVGRWFQDQTYDSFSFDRDYQSYFPLGATLLQQGKEKVIPVTQIKKGDRLLLRNHEMIPADAVLIAGQANLDYSFVSGETAPVQKNTGELLFAGGKQVGSAIEIEIVKPISQSYITQLWNSDTFKQEKNKQQSFIHPWSRWFTIALFSVAIVTAIYWWMVNPSQLLPAVTAVLIVACPCSLLLTVTFTYGNMMRIFGRNKCYLKNASVIESMAKTDTIVFDKTGTLTSHDTQHISYEGTPLTAAENAAIKAVCRQSAHPLSRLLYTCLPENTHLGLVVKNFEEISGNGITAWVNNIHIVLGAAHFVAPYDPPNHHTNDTCIHVVINKSWMGMFRISSGYRNGLKAMATHLEKKQYNKVVLSGDNDNAKIQLRQILGYNTHFVFNHQPAEKLNFIAQLQQQGKKIMMLGDGLNDAGALRQAQTGIAVSNHHTQFTPASDAIMHGDSVHLTDRFLLFAKSGKQIITLIFIVSIIYNVIGLSFATQAMLSPMIAAILMPASSISIVLLVTLLTNFKARKLGL
jgi:Cu+-exporting ATPase